MSLFVNPNGKIVMSATNKPVECPRCPCQNIIGDPSVYCVKEDFYSGDGCTGSVLTSKPHQCLCMTPNCDSTWDKATFCQDRVKYTYESGPNIFCPDNCNPATCPTDCSSCPLHFSLTTSGMSGTNCSIMNQSWTSLNRVGCTWSFIVGAFPINAALACNATTHKWTITLNYQLTVQAVFEGGTGSCPPLSSVTPYVKISGACSGGTCVLS